jgi:hypothetical protein
MGHSSDTIAQWQGQTAEVRALLESTEIILRGGIRERVPRSAITSMRVDQGWLRLDTDRGPLVLELGEGEAARWLKALQKPVPSLAEKLGLSAGCLAFVLGAVQDAALAAALRDAVTPDLGRAGVLVVVLGKAADLAAAFALAQSAPEMGVWCVYPKGRGATVTDAMVRGFFRDRGYVDSKACAVSDVLTATRYGRRRG